MKDIETEHFHLDGKTRVLTEKRHSLLVPGATLKPRDPDTVLGISIWSPFWPRLICGLYIATFVFGTISAIAWSLR